MMEGTARRRAAVRRTGGKSTSMDKPKGLLGRVKRDNGPTLI